MKFPPSSTGFILDGFPRYPDEAQFLGEHGFFPDAAVIIQVDDQDIYERLLPSQMEKWKQKQKKKLDRKKLIKEIKAKIKVCIQYKSMGVNLFSIYSIYKMVFTKILFPDFNITINMKILFINY